MPFKGTSMKKMFIPTISSHFKTVEVQISNEFNEVKESSLKLHSMKLGSRTSNKWLM
jgi:hypothetical protein